MDINGTLKYLYDLQFFGVKMGLENIRVLCEENGNPQNHYPTVHVAGTNGKGTVCACLDTIFREAGYRTGLYTSPHIYHFSERIRVNGKPIEEEAIVRYTQQLRPCIEKIKATFFEATTAMAFLYFAERQTEWAVIETGMGGRLDATNIVLPEVAIITSIDFDHMEYLGNTKCAIACEKGGIIKPHRPVIIGDPDPEVKKVLQDIALRQKAEVVDMDQHAIIRHLRMNERGSRFDLEVYLRGQCERWDDLSIPFIGAHQVRNAAMAVLAARTQVRLPVSDEAIRKGLTQAYIPGRLEWLAPNIVMDAAHNPASLMALTKVIREVFSPKFKRIYMVIGMLKDKDVNQCADILQGQASLYYCVTPDSSRALAAEDLAGTFQKKGIPALACASMEEAFALAREKMDPNDLLIITGSHFVLSLMRPGRI